MRSVGIKVLKNKLSEYIRLVATTGETVLVTDRDRVVAELRSPSPGRAPDVGDAVLADLMRRGLLIPATASGPPPPPGPGVMPLEDLLRRLDEIRADRA